jgi:hypothetical protein
MKFDLMARSAHLLVECEELKRSANSQITLVTGSLESGKSIFLVGRERIIAS